jgi:hypothetical protein
MATNVTPPGNRFDFYVPRPALGAKRFPAAKQPKPHSFIKMRFKAVSTVPFGTGGTVATMNVISDVAFVSAILECGYGRRADWTSQLVLSRRECADLMRYLKARLALVLASFEVRNQSRRPRPFYAKVEASEKVSLSFILGGIGAYLAAHAWLKAAGDSVKSFLHVGIYAKSSSRSGPLISFALSSGKSPDFLVEAQSGEWHVFESKGGIASGRWSRICEGLTQLENLPPIGWKAAGPTQPATTCVCVHTSIDPGRALAFTAIDPPGAGDYDDQPITLIEGVCRLLLITEAIEQFRALTTGATFQVSALTGWTLAVTSFSEDMTLGIPARYLRAEKQVRCRLAVFLAVREFLERASSQNSSQTFIGRLRRAVRRRMAQRTEDADALLVPLPWLDRKLEQLPRSHLQGEFLVECARVLRLDRLAKRLSVDEDERKRIVSASQSGQLALTSAGLLLDQASQGTPHTTDVKQPSMPRG